jgi:hypothetical protein
MNSLRDSSTASIASTGQQRDARFQVQPGNLLLKISKTYEPNGKRSTPRPQFSRMNASLSLFSSGRPVPSATRLSTVSSALIALLMRQSRVQAKTAMATYNM